MQENKSTGKTGIGKNCRPEQVLFAKLKDKGVFWSYSRDIKYEDFNDNILIEHTLKYGGFDDIKLIIDVFGEKKVQDEWRKNMMTDRRFIRVNLMIARVFFGMDVEADYFKRLKNARYEKLKLLAT